MRPKVSIVMPVYNCQKYVSKSVESILNQSFEDFEFIIIDGKSTDGTIEILKKYEDNRLRIVETNKRLGLVESRNKGLDMANGSLIALQDADDISHPQRIAEQYSSFRSDRDLAVLGTCYTRIDKNDCAMERKHVKEEITLADLAAGMQLCNGSIMFRRDALLKVGFYDTLFKVSEDYELLCRFSKEGYKIRNLHNFLYLLRDHSGRLSATRWEEQILYTCLVRDVYFGSLKKKDIAEIRNADLHSLYSLLSLETKKMYHSHVALGYMKSKQYLYSMREFLNLTKLDPAAPSRLIAQVARARYLKIGM